MSKVTIIIPFYNCPYISYALDSLVNQTYKNTEIIVINDGSTKHTEKISPYLDKIKYLKKVNGGTASALNTGIQHATGEYICWLSSDDVFDIKKIEIQLDFMKKSGALFSYTNYYCIDEKGAVFTPPVGIYVSSRLEVLRRMIKGNIINGCSVMIHQSVFNQVGIFDETLPYTHDYDLWLRIIQKFDIYYISEPLLFYRIHDQMGTKKYEKVIKKEAHTVFNRHIGEIKRLLFEQIRKERP